MYKSYPISSIGNWIYNFTPKVIVARSILLILILIPLFSSCTGKVNAASILRVGPGKPYAKPSQAAAVAKDKDIIEIDAGIYTADVAVWHANNLTIRGVGGKAHLKANGASAQGKGIWVIAGDNTTIENIEFSDAVVPDHNGAGIRLEGSGLTVRNCYFHDNEMGILTGANPKSDLLIEYSEFANNYYRGDDSSVHAHNIYVGKIRSFTLRYSYIHHARIGHNVKSRAQENYILYNRIMDEQTGASSYAIDLPNGGASYLIGNLIQQGPDTDNFSIIAYAAEGGTNPVQQLYVVNNTFVNDYPSGGIFVQIFGNPKVTLINNLFVGPGTVLWGKGQQIANLVTQDSPFVDRANFDYHLVKGSPAIDAGVNPGKANNVDLTPIWQYVHLANREPRTMVGSAIDIGAYEFGTPSFSDKIPPSVPSHLTATVISSSQIDLSWLPATDNMGVVGYKIYRNGKLLSTTHSTVFSDTTLEPSTTYTYTVSAYDGAGNDSPQSPGISATTQALVQTPPSVSHNPQIKLDKENSPEVITNLKSLLQNLPDNTALDLGKYTCDQPADDPSWCEAITDYSRLIYDKFNHQLLMFGGGHASTFRDDVSVFNFNTLTWQSAYPSTLCSEMTNLANMDKVNGKWITTGHPLARHTYDMLVIPDNTKKLLLLGYANGTGRCTPRVDPVTKNEPLYQKNSKVAIYDPVAKTWSYTSVDAMDPTAAAEYDPVSGLVVIMSQYGLWTYNPITNKRTPVLSYADGALGYANNLIYYPPNQKMYYLARGNPTRVFEITLNRKNWSASKIKEVTDMTGDIPNSQESGWAYDSVNQIIGGGVANGVFYAYNPLTKTWASRIMQTQPAGSSVGTLAFHALDYDPVD
ncbi:MAG TPA: right-handed parallel beta-helix repeat-containing protein, partial [Candidatus Limnocylindrales bacterium]|nr:right-handed parallel beta-helix repeat-containing protein [Candidatus Limnocylindrales bacterium]